MSNPTSIARRMIERYRYWSDIVMPAVVKSGQLAVDEAEWEPDEPGTYCRRCGATAAREAITISGCPHCRDARVAWHGVWRLGAYADPLDQWVRDYKFGRAYVWAEWFAARLAERTPDFESQVVVPVPLNWRRRLQRGFDQATLLARPFAEAKGAPLTPLLRRTRATHPQSLIRNQAARRRNVSRAFDVRTPVDLTGVSVWLVDDVKTSGNTARVCTRLLRKLGAERVNLVVVAVADPKRADFQRN